MSRQIKAKTGKFGFMMTFSEDGNLKSILASEGIPLTDAAKKKAHDYWKQNLAGGLPVLELPADRTRTATVSGLLHTASLSMDATPLRSAAARLQMPPGCA